MLAAFVYILDNDEAEKLEDDRIFDGKILICSPM